MTFLKRVLLGVVAATVLLALTAGTAGALRSMEVNEKSINAKFSELSFLEPVFGLSVICPVTFGIEFWEERFSKRAAEIGQVSQITWEERSCRNGKMRFLATLPWIILYNGFTGTLPEILTVRLIFRRMSVLLETLPGDCLYQGEIAFIANIRSGEFSTLEAENGRTIPLFRALSGSCSSVIRARGTATVVRKRDLLGGVTLRLV